MRVECLRDPASPAWSLRLHPDGEDEDVRLDGAGLRALVDVIDAAEREDACRALLVESESPTVFCRGMDLAFLERHADDDLQPRLDAYAEAMERLRACRRPTLAIVDGEVRGGGVGLAAACDIVLATARATWALPELIVGLVPAMVMPLVHERVRPKLARWLALTATTVDAEWALRHGLADGDVVFADRDAAAKAARRTLRTLRRIHPGSVGRLKDHDADVAGCSVAEGLRRGASRTGRDVRDPEILAGVTAMGEGDLPPWVWRPPRTPTEGGDGA